METINKLEIQINTNVNGQFYPDVDSQAFDELVRDRAQYITEKTRDCYYTYKSMMLWVAEETKSVVQCDETNGIYSFNYVGI